jgi:hypothetical protein
LPVTFLRASNALTQKSHIKKPQLTGYIVLADGYFILTMNFPTSTLSDGSICQLIIELATTMNGLKSRH